MNQLQSIRDGIRELENAKRIIENQIRELHKTYMEMSELLDKPEYTDGSRYPDYGSYPPNIVSSQEVAEYVPFADYDPVSEKWIAIVEWEINKGRGASDPYVMDSFNTPEEAFAVANQKAKTLSLQSMNN